jgi:hypothetical protein
MGWQQFVFSDAGYMFMQYWLLGWGATCPAAPLPGEQRDGGAVLREKSTQGLGVPASPPQPNFTLRPERLRFE